MPNKNKNNEGAGDNGSGAAGAEQGNGGNAGAGQGAGSDDKVIMTKAEVEKLQADLKKSNEDRDNYKAGLLQKKADERDLKSGDKGDGGQGGGNVIDEKKISDVATAVTNKVLRDASEKTAKRVFLKNHPEYVDDAQWTALMANLTFRGNELTHDDVLGRMEAALLEHKRSTGKLEEYLRAEYERGVREGRIQGELGSGRGGDAGDRNEGGKTGKLSPKGEEMARAMHTDPEKAAKVDPLKDNVINVV